MMERAKPECSFALFAIGMFAQAAVSPWYPETKGIRLDAVAKGRREAAK